VRTGYNKIQATEKLAGAKSRKIEKGGRKRDRNVKDKISGI